MKGKIVMKCRPVGGKTRIRTKVDLRKVDSAGKVELLNAFLQGLEIPVAAAAGYLLDILDGAVEAEVVLDERDGTEVVGNA